MLDLFLYWVCAFWPTSEELPSSATSNHQRAFTSVNNANWGRWPNGTMGCSDPVKRCLCNRWRFVNLLLSLKCLHLRCRIPIFCVARLGKNVLGGRSCEFARQSSWYLLSMWIRAGWSGTAKQAARCPLYLSTKRWDSGGYEQKCHALTVFGQGVIWVGILCLYV
jgi:hypothetical protein